MATANLIAAIESLEAETSGELLLSDGATTWESNNLIDALTINDDPNSPDREYTVVWTSDGRGQIFQLNDGGYMLSVPVFSQVRPGERR